MIAVPTYSTFRVDWETNGKGYIGFVVELPGAFVRGRTEDEAVAKLDREINSYYRWLEIDPPRKISHSPGQKNHTTAIVEDGDTEVLLQADRDGLQQPEFETLISLLHHSAESIEYLFKNARQPGWVDPARAGNCFYGDRPASISDMYDHLRRAQPYYLSRLGLYPDKKSVSIVDTRRECINHLRQFFAGDDRDRIFDHEKELWTLKKVLRRVLWHDRIHAKSMVRISAKQKRLGLIEDFIDIFYFNLTQDGT